MHIEIAQAVDFLGRLLQSKLEESSITNFKEKLTELLKSKFINHWDTQQPFKGNGFRAISNFNGVLDPTLTKAAISASIPATTILTHLPRDFVLWIDPYSVAYRVGDHGNIMTLFEDRSRGRITFKLDPTNNNNTNSNTLNATNTNANNNNHTILPKSPSQSPLLQYIQPRTTTPIRISPPSSPEALKVKNQTNQSSPLSNQVTPSNHDNDEEEGQHKQQLVMAN
ncbi:hypothetical protein BJ944DRAFT_290716 [Cunninghamella echinulata]|nr:hypothetical protein BJ944DRAFT_290716 [Cunninghamella echinulata]